MGREFSLWRVWCRSLYERSGRSWDLETYHSRRLRFVDTRSISSSPSQKYTAEHSATKTKWCSSTGNTHDSPLQLQSRYHIQETTVSNFYKAHTEVSFIISRSLLLFSRDCVIMNPTYVVNYSCGKGVLMARPKRCRRICTEPDFDAFAPAGIPCAETVTLTLEEYETIRLIDLENCTHQQCAQQMDISRTTVTELYEKARYKIADSLIGGKRLVISGGDYRLCDGSAAFCCHKRCRENPADNGSSDTLLALQSKGESTMRIAVTYENGAVFSAFWTH